MLKPLAAYIWPRSFRPINDEERLFDVAADVKVVGRCRWQKNRTENPTVVMWHGIEGSTESTYMISMAEKLYAEGFSVIRMNLRTCGGTEHLASTLYHGGLTHDLREVVHELIDKDHLPRLLLMGFSLGGNMVLKLAGEYGANYPKEVLCVAAVSPSVDLHASAELIMKRSNWVYHRDFVWRLKRRIRTKQKLFPELYDISDLGSVRTLKEFDDRYTARANGFADANDYYFKGSAKRVIAEVHIPTLIIHAQDDPFIPFAPLQDPAIANNPYILLIDPERGGHVAFVTGKPTSRVEDRFWAENRLVDFCRLASKLL